MLIGQQRDAAAAAEAEQAPSWLGLGYEAVKGWASGMNPLPLLEQMYSDTAGHFTAAADAAKKGDYRKLAGEMFAIPGAPADALIGGLVGAHWQQFVKAKRAYDEGNYSEAVGHTAAGILPMVGPMAAQAGEDIGTGDPRTMARGVGEGIAAARPQLPAEMGGALVRGVRGVGRLASPAAHLNPLEAASNAFAESRGVPLDAATATGSRWARAAQKRVANSMGGEATASEMIGQQRDALGRVGDELASDVNAAGAGKAGPAVGPEEAAEGTRNSIRDLITTLHDEANTQYGKLRGYEAKHVDQVPLPPAPIDAVPDYMKAQLRRIVHEMDASGYVKGQLQDERFVDPELHVGGSGQVYSRGSGGAKVYHDITEVMGHEGLSRAEIQDQIERYMGGGQETVATKAALEVARKRYQGNPAISRPEMDLETTGDVPTRHEAARQQTGAMNLAVDLRAAKTALRPIYERLKREGELAPLMGGKADGLRALDRLVNGPDHAPLSVVDGALGDLKSMARGASMPELRTAGQGTAAFAVQQLEKLVRARALAAGPEVLQALEEGRSATKAKAEVGDVLETLREEPIAAFRQLTAPKDAGIKMLRAVRDVAPMKMQDVARAWLEQQLTLARQEGGFGHADRLWSDWNKLGPETKQILFAAPGQTEALDRFFLLAKRIAENPNPSGTAHTMTAFNVLGQIPMYALAKMLYTARGVEAIRGWVRAGAPATTRAGTSVAAPRGVRALAWAGVRQAAKQAGVELPSAVPLAADADEQR